MGDIFGGSKDKVSTVTPYGSEYIDFANTQAKNLYNQFKGTPAPVAPLNANTRQAFNMTAASAKRPVPGLDNAFGFTSNMLANNGMTRDMRQVAGYLTPFADGSMQEDPRLQQLLDTNADRAANATATRFGGGRYGSAAIGNAMGSAVADANNATMLQSNENARSRQLQASGLLGQMYDSGAARAMQAGAMLPGLNNLRYDGASRLAGIGDFLMNRDQTLLDNKRNNGWEQLAQYNAIINGNGRLGNSTSTPGPSTAQSILGGAVAGKALLGPWGMLGGGILGAFS